MVKDEDEDEDEEGVWEAVGRAEVAGGVVVGGIGSQATRWKKSG